MEQKTSCWGFLRGRQCLVPTWRGWLALLASLTALAFLAMHTIQPFLAVNAPLPGGLLVVEGWATDHTLEAAVAEFHRHAYDKIYVTGGPMEKGVPLFEYKTYAQLGAATLLKFGLSSNVVQAVPAPWVRRDRTYTEAVSLHAWLRAHGQAPSKIYLITEGPHARRSRLLFKKAFGKGVTVGVMAVPVQSYNPQQWWRSSAGVRIVLSETLAYAYARFLFWPAKARP